MLSASQSRLRGEHLPCAGPCAGRCVPRSHCCAPVCRGTQAQEAVTQVLTMPPRLGQLSQSAFPQNFTRTLFIWCLEQPQGGRHLDEAQSLNKEPRYVATESQAQTTST